MSENILESSKVTLFGLLNGIKIINEEGIPQGYGIWKEETSSTSTSTSTSSFSTSQSILLLKEQSERLSNSCTKVGMVSNSSCHSLTHFLSLLKIKIAEMPLTGLKSLIDEVLLGVQSVFQCYRFLFP